MPSHKEGGIRRHAIPSLGPYAFFVLLLATLSLMSCRNFGNFWEHNDTQSKVEKTYTINYSGNTQDSGVPPIDLGNYSAGAVVTVLGNTGGLVKAGFTFAGWNSQLDGLGTDYAGGTTFLIGSSNMTLYAKWTNLPTYTVTYSGNVQNSGSPPTDSNNYLPGATVTVPGNTGSLAKTGFTFAGWNTLANGLGTDYAAAGTFPMGAANITLYAKWAPTYTVTYSGNSQTSGTPPTDSTNYIQTATVTVLSNTGSLVKAGFTFSGWNTLSNGSGTDYSGGATFAMGAANVTLYAKWTPTYTVTYSGNGSDGGTPPTDGLSYIVSDTVTVLGNTGSLTKTAFTFAGWNTLANGLGTDYAGGATFAMGATNITLYAKWTAVPTFTVTYSGNGNTVGSPPTDSTNYITTATVTVLGNIASLGKTGFAFAGWNSLANGLGTDYAPGATFAMGAANVTLYAKWVVPSVYVATSAGLSISTDGGANFTNIALGATVQGVYAQGSNVYAATLSGLQISTNGGSSFTNYLSGTNVTGVHGNGAGAVYVSTFTAGVYVTTNNGSSFTNATTGQGVGTSPLSGIFSSGGNIYVASGSGVSISTNGGTSFVTTAVGSTVYGVYVQGSNVYASTNNGISISSDGGATYPLSIAKNTSGLGNSSGNGIFAQGINVYGATNGSGLSISTDGGSTYNTRTLANSTLAGNVVKGVFVLDGIIYAACSTGGLSISSNAGTTFASRTTAQGLGSNTTNGVYVSP